MWALKWGSSYVESWSTGNSAVYTSDIELAEKWPTFESVVGFLLNRTYQAGRAWGGESGPARNWNSGLFPIEVKQVSRPEWEEVA